jgi:hypothetical protein
LQLPAGLVAGEKPFVVVRNCDPGDFDFVHVPKILDLP